tara:strand:+ start:1151 stop:1741 length:591 start_codon:yes stop_codon:yes gene_type:complete
MRNNSALYKGMLFFMCFSFVFSKSKSRIITTFDLLDPYKIISTNINDDQDVNVFSDSIYGINLASEHLVVNTKVFNMYIGGEFMVGRKSISTIAFHSIYLMPAISINNVLFSTRFGLAHLNTDNPDFLFKWNGLLTSFGIEYQVSNNMSLGASFTSYNMNNKINEGKELDLIYDKIGISIIYGFAMSNNKEKNEKK